MRIAGAVLTGGASRRMGRTKAIIDVDGRPLGERSIDALRSVGATPVVLVGGDPDELALLGVPVVADRWPGEGPVGGLLTALAHFRELGDVDAVIVLSCDLDRISAATVGTVLAASGTPDCAVRVAATDRIEPMCAVWSVDVEPLVAAAFAAGTRALHAVIAELAHVTVTVSDDEMHNVNRPEDLSLPPAPG